MDAKDWYQISIPIHQMATSFNGRYNPAAEAMTRSAQAGLQQELIKEAEKKREKQRKAGMWGDIAGLVAGPLPAAAVTKMKGGTTGQAIKSGAEALMNNARMAAGDPSGYATTAMRVGEEGLSGGGAASSEATMSDAVNASGGIPVMSPSGQKMGNVPAPTQQAASAYGSAPGRPNMAPPPDPSGFAQSAAGPTAQGGVMSNPAYQAQTPPGGVQQDSLMQTLGRAGAKVGGVFGETGARVGSEIFQRAPELLTAAQGMMGQQSTIPELSSVYGLTPEQAGQVYGTLQKDEMFRQGQAQDQQIAQQRSVSEQRRFEQQEQNRLIEHRDKMKNERDRIKNQLEIAKMEDDIAKAKQQLAEREENRRAEAGSRQYLSPGSIVADVETGETLASNPYRRSVGGGSVAEGGGVNTGELTAGQQRMIKAQIEPYESQYQTIMSNLASQKEFLENQLNRISPSVDKAEAAAQLREVQQAINETQNNWITMQQNALQYVTQGGATAPGSASQGTQAPITTMDYDPTSGQLIKR